MKILLIALVLLASQASFAVKECINEHAIRNFKAIDRSTLEIDAGKNDYIMTVGICNELEWTHSIGFDSFGARVCRGDTLLILDTFNNHVKERCRILSIEKIQQ